MPRNRATNETIHPRFATYLSPADSSATPHWAASSVPLTTGHPPWPGAGGAPATLTPAGFLGPTTPTSAYTHRDSPNLGEQPTPRSRARSWGVPFQSVQQQRHNRSPNHDGQMAYPGHFDPLGADHIIDTTNLLVRVFVTIPRFLYFSMLLFLPFFYRARVNQILRGVHLTEHEIASYYRSGRSRSHLRPKHWENVKVSWSAFVDSVVKEWGTLNFVSVLLLS